MGKSSLALFRPSCRVVSITLVLVLYLFLAVMYAFSIRSGFPTRVSFGDSLNHALFIFPVKMFLGIANMFVLESGSLTQGDFFRFPLFRGLVGSLAIMTALFYLAACFIDQLLTNKKSK